MITAFNLSESRKIKISKLWNYGIVFSISILLTIVLSRDSIILEQKPKDIKIVSDKLEYFSKHKDEFNTIFLGSSQTYRQVIPSVFEESMKVQGHEIKAFNFGIPGLNLTEAKFYLEKILALQPKNLNWLFIEYIEGLDVKPENFLANREIYWHNLENTLTVSRLIWESNFRLSKKIQLTLHNFIPFTHHMFRSGQGSQLIQSRLNHRPKQQKTVEGLGEFKDGHISLDEENKKYLLEAHRKFVNNVEDYSRKVDRLKDRIAKPRPNLFSPHATQVISKMIASVKSQNIEPIFFISSIFWPQEATIAAYEQGYIPTLFQFNDPHQYPSLYQHQNRFDTDYLNREGAKELTELLAKKFASHLQ